MAKIYIEIARTTNGLDLYRFEGEDRHARAISFLNEQLLDRKDVAGWMMSSNCRSHWNPEDYDLIED